MVMKPIYDKIVLKVPAKQETTTSTGLVYTKDMSQTANTTLVADVIAVGDGRLLNDGQIIPLQVKVGDKVIVSKHQGESYTDETGEYTIVSESHILSILKREEEDI